MQFLRVENGFINKDNILEISIVPVFEAGRYSSRSGEQQDVYRIKVTSNNFDDFELPDKFESEESVVKAVNDLFFNLFELDEQHQFIKCKLSYSSVVYRRVGSVDGMFIKEQDAKTYLLNVYGSSNKYTIRCKTYEEAYNILKGIVVDMKSRCLFSEFQI